MIKLIDILKELQINNPVPKTYDFTKGVPNFNYNDLKIGDIIIRFSGIYKIIRKNSNGTFTCESSHTHGDDSFTIDVSKNELNRINRAY